MKKILLVTTALIISTPAYATEDGFGNRFGNSTPYALDNTVNNALDDSQGLGVEDINDLINIEPAAGDEIDSSIIDGNTDVSLDATAGAEEAAEDAANTTTPVTEITTDTQSNAPDANAVVNDIQSGAAVNVEIAPTTPTEKEIKIESVTETETEAEAAVDADENVDAGMGAEAAIDAEIKADTAKTETPVTKVTPAAE